MTIKKLKTDYDIICHTFVEKFAKKHDIEFDYWIGDEIGGIASFIDQYFFNISDIILDLTTNQPKYSILIWQEDELEQSMNTDIPRYINYKSYTMGLRQKDLEK
jgi:hypothetical protein